MQWKPKVEGVDWLHAGFSERSGGVSSAYGIDQAGGTLNLGWTTEDAQESVAENRRRWMAAVWDDGEGGELRGESPHDRPPGLVTLAQVHSAVSVLVGRTDVPRADAPDRVSLKGDGLMTAETGLLLGIQTADCVPVLVVDVRLRAVAAFHAGWRGTADRIVEQGVGEMRQAFGSEPEDLWAAVGPAIARCCYTVGEEVGERFRGAFSYGDQVLSTRAEAPRWERLPSRPGGGACRGEPEAPGTESLFLDLHASNRRQLADAGIPAEQIDVLRECTACTRAADGAMRYFSYRAEGGSTGRMMALIGMDARTGVAPRARMVS